MDYFEGLFLGSMWSDTDFENRRHTGLFIGFGVLLCAMIALSYLSGYFSVLLGGARIVKLVILLLLFFASRFLCFRYYRMRFWGKVPVLLAGLIKHVAFTLFATTWIMPFLNLSVSQIGAKLLDFLNSTLESNIEKFSDSTGSFSTVFGVLTGGIYVVFLAVIVVLLAIMVPGTILLIFRQLQYGYDKLVAKFVLTNQIDR